METRSVRSVGPAGVVGSGRPAVRTPEEVRRTYGHLFGQDRFTGSGAPAAPSATNDPVAVAVAQMATAAKALFRLVGEVVGLLVRNAMQALNGVQPVIVTPQPGVPMNAPPVPVVSPPPPAVPTTPPLAPGGQGPLKGPFYVDRSIRAPLELYGATGAHWLSDVGQSRPGVEQTLREAAKHGETPVFVQYTVPNRDVGGPSRGGAGGTEAYLADIQDTATAIGDANAVVILEPDALASSLDPETIRRAVEIYKRTCPNLKLYVDAGHSGWCPVDEIADKLVKAGIDKADGFSLNVSAFQWTNDNLAYGNRIVDALIQRNPALADKKFVIDTSRNGNGPGVGENGQWVWGDPVRAQNGGPIMTGPMPTTETGDPRCAAFLWIKLPGFGDNRIRHHSQFGGADWVAPNRNAPLGP